MLILLALVAGLALISVRRYETTRGVRYFENARTAFDAYAEALWATLVLGGIPMSWRSFMRSVGHEVSHSTVRLAVETIRAVERPLARLSYKMRVSAPKGNTAPVSDFLRTLSPEKK